MSRKKTNEGPEKSFPKAPYRPELTGKKSFLILFVVLVFVGAAAFLLFLRGRSGRVVALGAYKDYNILLITLDTLRADHLPMYGYTKVKTPNLDKLAQESIVFQDAISHAPLTLPSHTCILTGLLPVAHGVRDNGGFFVDPKEVTLAEIFKNRGYATSAFVSSFVLDSRWGLNQGFDLYYDHFDISQSEDLNPRYIQRRAGETEPEVEKWLEENRGRRFFSWVHFYDPHDPYDPPEPYRTEYAANLYDGEIAYTDENIGKLLRKLEELQLKDKTIIVVTGDHGEGLGEHHERTHAMFVYNTTQHVPLLMHLPGQRPHRVNGVVRHIDLAPTILQLLGIDVPTEMQGASLIPLMNGTEKTKRFAYSESLYAEIHYGWSSLQSITTEDYRFIDAPSPELYDRIHDPKETENLITEKASIAKALKTELQDILRASARRNLKGPQKMDPETEEKLLALGYIGGTSTATVESRKVDPKDKIHLVVGVSKAYDATRKKNYAAAIQLITPVLQEDPHMIDSHFVAGVAYIGLREYDKAVDELLKVVALKPDYTMALYKLGEAYEMQGNLKEAESWYQTILKYEQKHRPATLKLAQIYQRMGQPQKAKFYFAQAVQYYEESLQTTTDDQARSELYTALGDIHFRAGELDRAGESYKAAIMLTPDRKALHYNLGLIYEAKGDFVGAVGEYKKEIEIDPSGFKAFNNLGLLYRQLNRLEEAVLCFQKVIELYPGDPRGYVLLASTYRRLGNRLEADEILRKGEERGLIVR